MSDIHSVSASVDALISNLEAAIEAKDSDLLDASLAEAKSLKRNIDALAGNAPPPAHEPEVH